eukprot:44425-Pyramimonas_sp.AAC.1
MAGGWAPTHSSSNSGLGAEKAPSRMEKTSPKPTASTPVLGSSSPKSLAGPTKRRREAVVRVPLVLRVRQ